MQYTCTKVLHFIAEIVSDNIQSINFHKKQGFQQCGLLSNVGFKRMIIFL